MARPEGFKHSEEARKKMSIAATLRSSRPEEVERLRSLRKGIAHSEVHKQRLREISNNLGLKPPTLYGEENPNWKGGITPNNHKIRNSLAYKAWRTAVFERDNYTCQICGQYGGVLNADHIKRFSDYPELRFELSNGRTLCYECHRQTHNFKTKGWRKVVAR